MYAIIDDRGRQYKVREGDVLEVDRIAGNTGEPIVFDRVMLWSRGDDVAVGTPYVEGARVTARVLRAVRDRKVTVFKIKRRKNYRRKRGHRQGHLRVQIESIEVPQPSRTETPGGSF